MELKFPAHERESEVGAESGGQVSVGWAEERHCCAVGMESCDPLYEAMRGGEHHAET